MRNSNSQQQLFHAQCNGLSSAWGRAAAEEARAEQQGHPAPLVGRTHRMRAWCGSAALAAAVETVLWMLVSPADSVAMPLAGAPALALKALAA